MSKICTHFDAYFEKWSAPVGALCTLLVQNRADAQDVAFQSFLRLGGAKDREIGEEAAGILLFRSAVRLCDDYYLKRMHRRPSRRRLERQTLPFPVTDALISLLRLPFKRQAALALTQFGFSAAGVAEILGVRVQRARRLCADPGIPGWQEALSSMAMTENEAALLSDRICERFAERSVGVENAIHDARNAFDRAAPYLALLVLALFAVAIAYVRSL